MNPLFVPLMFALGLAFGSFLSMLIPRIYKKESGIVFGRSRCIICKKTLQPRDLIPVLSYLLNKGKCRFCDSKVSKVYPVIELTTGLLFSATYMAFPFSTVYGVPLTVFYLVMALVLIFTFFYDFSYMEISDIVLLPAIGIALLGTMFKQTPTITSALIGMGIGIGFFLIQILISKGKWVGGGDIRIGAFMGALLGWQMTLVALISSYVIGSICSITLIAKGGKKIGSKIPLGPFLVTGTFLALFWGDEILRWYINLLT